MPEIKIIWSSQAIKDLDEIYNYIAEDSEYQARKFTKGLKESVNNLTVFPEMGFKFKEDELGLTRILVYKKYKIYYEQFKNDIFIHAVIHSKRLITPDDIY